MAPPRIDDNPLLTSKAFATSLTPPRVPPFGSIHRELYTSSSNHHPRLPHHRLLLLPTKQQKKVTSPSIRIPLHYHVNRHSSQHGEDYDGGGEETIIDHFHQRLLLAAVRRNRPHPHMAATSSMSAGDAATRYIRASSSHLWSIDSMNRFRDSGWFRSVVDGLVAVTAAPILALSSSPSITILPFLRLTAQRQILRYGTAHERQYLEVWEKSASPPLSPSSPSLSTAADPTTTASSTNSSRRRKQRRRRPRWIVFIHGGAWGSGQAWMYRLVAAPFLADGSYDGVAIGSYRVYPDGSIDEQVDDVHAMLRRLILHYNNNSSSSSSTTTTTKQQQHQPTTTQKKKKMNITLVGHSSGAHVALLWLVRQRLGCSNDDKTTTTTSDDSLFQCVDSFVGLSGPYDIADHFDYEAGRGVEELSPMKPVNGYTRSAFRHNSPAPWLHRAVGQRDALGWTTTTTTTTTTTHQDEDHNNNHLPKIVLMHGVEDDTVPFTATAEAARILNACGISVEQVYLPKTGHQDIPVQLMVGGRARDVVLEWIGALDDNDDDDDDAAWNDDKTTTDHQQQTTEQRPTVQPIIRSKL
jgi:acetyl esterase/lipase